MALQAKGPQWANALKTMGPTLEWVVSFIVFREWGMIKLWTILRLAGIKLLKVSSITSFLISASLESVFMWSASFHLQGSASCKNSRMCVKSLSIAFAEAKSLVILLCGRINQVELVNLLPVP